MSAELQFVRLKFSNFPRSPWVRSFEIANNPPVHQGTHVSLTKERGRATIYITPPESQLGWLRGTIGPLELEPATFEEWIEQDPTRAAAQKS